MVKEVIKTEKFLGKLAKLDKSYIDRIEKSIIKILNNPEIGKPMRFDRKGTREFYIGSLRLSYAHDKNKDALYFLNICHKDEQ